jgi:ABC-type transport system substrate-binding protein
MMGDARNMSRREFLRLAGIAGATIGVGAGLGGVLAACASETTTTTGGAATTAQSSTQSTAAQPFASVSTTATTAGASTTTTAASTEPTGDLVFAVPTLGSEMFDQKWISDCILTVIPYQNLYRSNIPGVEQMGGYPWLAEKGEQSADGLTWDVYLKQGIPWHNNYGEVTADDVIFTFEQIQVADHQDPYGFIFSPPDQGGYMKSVEKIDTYHVRFNLSKSYNMFPVDLQDNGMWIYCKKYVEAVGWDKAIQEPVGTAPWRWVETVPGDHIKFEAFVTNWQKVPEFKTLTMKLVPDLPSELMMVQSGDADMAVITPAQAEQATAAGLQLYVVPNQRFVEVLFGGQLLQKKEHFDPTCPWDAHTDEPDTSEWNQRALKVRQAFVYAIDPQVIIDKVTYGYGKIDVLRDFNNQDPNYLPEWTPYPYDPAKAKQLLIDAGYPNGFAKPVQILIPATPTAGVDTKAIMQIVADQIEAIGLKVERKVQEQNLIDQTWTFGWDSAWQLTATVGYTNWVPIWGGQWCKASWGPTHVIGERPKFDELILKYIGELDPVKAVQIQQELGTYEYSQFMERGLYDAPVIYAFGPKIKGVSQQPYWLQEEQPPYFNFEYIQRA